MFTHWALGSDKTKENHFDCVQMTKEDGFKWSDTDCVFTKAAPICEREIEREVVSEEIVEEEEEKEDEEKEEEEKEKEKEEEEEEKEEEEEEEEEREKEEEEEEEEEKEGNGEEEEKLKDDEEPNKAKVLDLIAERKGEEGEK